MKVALLFEWEDLAGVYRSPELARRAAARSAGKSLRWEQPRAGGDYQVAYTNGRTSHFEVHEEEVLEA